MNVLSLKCNKTIDKLKIFLLLVNICAISFLSFRGNTVGENIIATIKMLNNLWYPLKMDFSLLLLI